MCGAEPAAWTAALPMLNAMGATVHHMGAVGSGCVAKLCGNHLVSAILASLAESLAMAKKSGLNCAELIRNYSESIGVPVMMSNMVHELNKVAQNMGWGELNATAVFKVFEVMAGMAPDASTIAIQP